MAIFYLIGVIVMFTLIFVNGNAMKEQWETMIFEKDARVVTYYRANKYFTLKLYGLEIKNGEVDRDGLIYGAVATILLSKEQNGELKYISINPETFMVDAVDFLSDEYRDVYTDLISVVTNYRFNHLVFNKDNDGVIGFDSKIMNDVREHTNKIISDVFFALVSDIQTEISDLVE